MSKNTQSSGASGSGNKKPPSKQSRQNQQSEPVESAPASQPKADNVYSLVLKEAIDDLALIEQPVAQCTCGKCGIAPNEPDAMVVGDYDEDWNGSLLSGAAPMLFVEVRANSDPIVLDEETVHSGSMVLASGDATTSGAAPESAGNRSPSPMLEALGLTEFDIDNFNPFDPHLIRASSTQ